MWLHCVQQCGFTVYSNVDSLCTAMWLHCIQQCGFTVHSNVASLCTAMWISCVQQYGFTVHNNVNSLCTQSTLSGEVRMICTRTEEHRWKTAHNGGIVREDDAFCGLTSRVGSDMMSDSYRQLGNTPSWQGVMHISYQGNKHQITYVPL